MVREFSSFKFNITTDTVVLFCQLMFVCLFYHTVLINACLIIDHSIIFSEVQMYAIFLETPHHGISLIYQCMRWSKLATF